MDSNSRFLLKSFRKYYKENQIILPSRFGRREFGFMFFDKTFVQRHVSFPNASEIQKFMIAQVPSHSYYSTAYYRKPNAPTMEEKEWLGADLIFDLDADHLEGAENMSYTEMLDQIKKEMINLVDTYLLGDLGFDEKQVSIVFSGGRGYHAHIEMNDVLGLGTHERREIVDYVTAKTLDIDWVFPFNKTVTSISSIGNMQRSNVSRNRTIPAEDSGGWRKRMRIALKDVVQDVCEMEPKELRKKYPSIKSSQASTINGYSEDLKKSRDLIFVNNKMNSLKKGTQEFLVKIMKEDVAIRLSGEVDEPVTADIKRLIRLPGSIHGKTGLRVLPLRRSELPDFEPLEDAMPKEYSDDDVLITMKKDAEITIKGQNFKLSGTMNVPEYAAVFLVGRKMADIGDGTKDNSFF